MEQLYQDYKDLAAIYIFYISEAHAMDDARPVGYAKELGIKEHTSFGERCAVAGRLLVDKKLTIPCLVDGMDGAAETAYQGWPDRVYLIRKDGTLAIAGNRGPRGFKPALEAAGKWLAEYKTTGIEPPPVELANEGGAFREVARQMSMAYQKGEHAEALTLAEKMHKLEPGDVGTTYNIACLHCLLGRQDEAYAWLEKAIDAGYDDADHLLADEDFKTIRDQERFKKLVERLRGA